MTNEHSVRIIGSGRAGGSLARALRTVGLTVDLLDRNCDPTTALEGTDVLVIAVPDDVIAEVAAAVKPGEGVIAHLSGSRTLDVLAPHARRASLHPLMSLQDPERGAARLLDSCAFAVSGDPSAVELVDALGGTSFTVDDGDRAAYHAAASIAANHLVALCAQVERLAHHIGAPPEPFFDMAAAALDNVRSSGAATALTGPASRADWETIESHLDSLPQAEHQLYRAAAKAAADLAGHPWPAHLDHYPGD